MKRLEQAIDYSPPVVSPDTRLGEVLLQMRPLETVSALEGGAEGYPAALLDCVLVVSHGHLVGMVTHAHLLQLAAQGISLEEQQVAAVMTVPPVVIRLEQDWSLATTLRCLRQHRTDYLPVLNAQGRLAGLITLERLLQQMNPEELRALAGYLHQEVCRLEGVQEQLAAERAERQRAEEALQLSESTLAWILDFTHVGIWNWNIVTNQVLWNDNHYRLLGWTPGQVKSCYEAWRDRVHPEDVVWVEQKIADAIATRSSYSEEYRILLPNGSVRWITARGRTVYSAHGQPLRMLGMILDISDRKQIESNLKQLNQTLEQQVQAQTTQLKMVLSAARMGIWEWDVVNNLQYWSPENFALLGLHSDDQGQVLDADGVVLSPTPTYELFLSRMHPEDRERVQQTQQQAFDPQKLYEVEFRVLFSDGTLHWLYSRGACICNEAGEPLRLMGVALDINERKQTEAQLKISLREKEILLKEVHHRVKNNMQLISSLLNLQASAIADPNMLQPFLESQRRVKTMALIHERLYQSNQLTHVGFADYVQDLVQYLFCSYNVKAEQIHLTLQIAEVELNPDMAIPCGLIINELVSNALKYAFPEPRKGELKVQFFLNSARCPMLVVQDNGVGFPASLDFRNVPSLGLQLVCELTEQLEGIIELHRENGCQFNITFGKAI